jgi:hypothetical protein
VDLVQASYGIKLSLTVLKARMYSCNNININGLEADILGTVGNIKEIK